MEPEEKSFLEAFEEKKLPSTLNVLTILTFIGCGFEFVADIVYYFISKYLFDTADKYLNQGNPDNLPSSVGKSYNAESFEVLKKSYEARLPILFINLFAITLCLIGAIKMRKQKADGYWMYLLGEVLPYFSAVFFIGFGLYAKPISWFGFLIPVTFILLYTSQRKHLS
jgi:hypothetical protein